jgi:hypothetical protein
VLQHHDTVLVAGIFYVKRFFVAESLFGCPTARFGGQAIFLRNARMEVMHEASGGCYCGNIRVTAAFTHELPAYRPRACDCDFCRKHGAAYVSDPQGSLRIRIRHEAEVSRFRQGSNSAEMLVCRTCGVMVGALYRESNRLFGALNAKVLNSLPSFGSELTVSPKLLSADEKAGRWRDIWFPDVVLEVQAGGPT